MNSPMLAETGSFSVPAHFEPLADDMPVYARAKTILKGDCHVRDDVSTDYPMGASKISTVKVVVPSCGVIS